MSSSSNTLWYVYGIVPADLSAAALPEGLDGARVVTEPSDGVAALVSLLDTRSYTPEAMETSAADVEWLSPRAVAHDRVLTAASDRGGVVPFPMFSLFSGRDALHDMLRDRAGQLASTLQRIGAAREYALRIYRIDAELLAALPSLSPRLGELAAQAAAASPGQRYLLERKLEGEKKGELRTVSQTVVDQIVDQLGVLSTEQVRSPIPRLADADTAPRGTMVLNAAFLIAPTRLEEFQKTLTALVARHGAQGFRFDFTGPWPAYHFAVEPVT